MSFYQNYLKRIFDTILSIVLLILLSPMLFLVAISLFVTMKNIRILFIQSRPGKNGKLFKLVKFKTMKDTYNLSGELLSDSDRLTAVGKILRRFSIDEFPQLINVIMGDMSLIGPRPLLPEYLSKYTKEQARRHEVKPGISGWAQINGRNTSTFSERFKNDVWYVDNITFLLDAQILLMTVLKVFKSEGILHQDPNTIDD